MYVSVNNNNHNNNPLTSTLTKTSVCILCTNNINGQVNLWFHEFTLRRLSVLWFGLFWLNLGKCEIILLYDK